MRSNQNPTPLIIQLMNVAACIAGGAVLSNHCEITKDAEFIIRKVLQYISPSGPWLTYVTCIINSINHNTEYKVQ